MSSPTSQSLSERLQNLMHINKTIAGCLDESNVLRCSLELETEIVDAESGSILLLDDSGEYLQFAVALGEAGDVLEDYKVRVGQGVAGYVAEHMEPVLIEDTKTDDRFDDFFDEQTGFNTQSMICAPIQVGERLLGVAQVINKNDGCSFTREDLVLFSAFAGQIGVSIENARLHEEIMDRERIRQELKTARKVQESYLPNEFPDLPGLEFGARLEPAQQVSGDFYDCFDLPDGRWAGVIGDVSGKGMPAAMYMCRVLTELRAGLSQGGSPREVINRVNRRLYDTSTEGMFVTLQLFVIDPVPQSVEVANAGHLPFYHLRNGAVEAVDSDDNPPLGIKKDHAYATYEFALQEDSVVFALTDGLVEARNDHGEMFGLDRISTLLESGCLPPRLLVEHAFRDVDHFSDGDERDDDMTVLSFGRPLDDQDYSYRIYSHPEYLDFVRDTVEQFLSQRGVEKERIQDLKVGVSEAVENIIEHTYHNQPDGAIEVDFEVNQGCFVCSLRDFGDPVSTQELQGRDLEDVEPGGLGLHFMDEIFDEHNYRREPDGNRLVLRRDL